MNTLNARITVVTVDNDPHMHDEIAGVLMKTVDAADIQLVGEAHNGETALMLCQIAKPDLVLMDVDMPGMSGVETAQELMARHPGLKVLVLASCRDYEPIKTMMDHGAAGYLVKEAAAEDLVETIRNLARGHTASTRETAEIRAVNPAGFPTDVTLSEQELQVLRLLAKGQTSSQIAATLGISQPTVRFHFNNILTNLNVQTRSEALVLAARNQLI